ncbi:MAG: methionine--tRNA ligase [Candidatus Brennerbacteria bacterium RIFOXYC1_FULL_41_11]|uniref:Methionine--tRNA ligase n=1 Tax=Candidatus Brennerbacteria bacterium RIFOXYD1_FULL_41_16 TaxID=1797529 RepID=A0A1G1XLW8_9BACT|nr:MAG: methionine--tRNA ligase [Candidatus Brennerbacteria bacterium RIFOXYC1_FULL_41_11]OGY40971.1 MAG: methionine--tRNA ligase [Candidatus Brennerbacteria bacterium RIFOXYD1_FULL_41_16]
MSQKFFITTAIPYANGEPHIGHLLEFIQADVVARHQRLLQKEVWFLTGTDEHGIKIAETAKKKGKEPQQFVDDISGKFKESAEALNVSFDYFIRTTDKKNHWPNVAKIWRSILDSGDIYKGHYKGRYCVGCEKYLVESDLEDGKCQIHKKEPIEIDEDNYFFKLSKYQDQLKNIIESGGLKIIPEFRKAEVLGFIENGLQDVSFSRPKNKLEWGIPVPDDDEQVIYVWADALTNYLSGVEYAQAGGKFQRFWPPDLQIVGKDIWKFHALIWPAMLLSAHLPLPKSLMIHGFLTVSGEKISKSLGNGISPIEIMKKYGVSSDAVRYFFLREINPFEDGDYSHEKFKARYNGDLANGVGNLVSRVSKLGNLYGKEIGLQENDFQEKINSVWNEYEKLISEYRFNEVLSLINRLVSEGDNYVNEHKPWELLKRDTSTSSEQIAGQFEKVISSLVLLLGNIAWMLDPFMPQTSEKILIMLGLASPKGMSGEQSRIIGSENYGWINKKIRFSEYSSLFPRLEK